MRKFSRAQIIERLRKQTQQEKPIIVANCSVGITAKYSEKEGADLIAVHSTGKYRWRGVPYPIPGVTYWGGTNEMEGNVFETHHEIDNAIDHTPIIAGLEAYDVFARKTEKLLKKTMNVGYDGIQNFPTMGYNILQRTLRDGPGFGFEREIKMIEIAHDMDIFTMAYAFWPDDAKRFTEVGADVIIAHAGWTAGGDTGAPKPETLKFDETVGFAAHPRSLDEMCKLAQQTIEVSRTVNPGVIVLVTGGSLSTPKDAQYIADHTDVDGFEIGHALESISLEKYLVEIGKAYKSLPLRIPSKR